MIKNYQQVSTLLSNMIKKLLAGQYTPIKYDKKLLVGQYTPVKYDKKNY